MIVSNIELFKNNPIYFVTHESLSQGRKDIDLVKKVIKSGIRVVQLRDKLSNKKDFLFKAKKIKTILQKFSKQFSKKVVLVINDHLDIALAIEADGVHLGQEDLPLVQARRIVQRSKSSLLIGVSTHNLKEAIQAQKEGADYINIGPIFSTLTKKNNYPPVGLSLLRRIIKKVHIPFSVMGGIKKGHLGELVACGVKTVAMITEITQQKNIQKHVTRLIDEFYFHQKKYLRN